MGRSYEALDERWQNGFLDRVQVSSMSLADYRVALRLVETALALITCRHACPAHAQRRLRQLALEVCLLRVQWAQAPAHSQRN